MYSLVPRRSRGGAWDGMRLVPTVPAYNAHVCYGVLLCVHIMCLFQTECAPSRTCRPIHVRYGIHVYVRMQVVAETHVDPEPVMLKVGSRVRLKEKDLYGFVRCVHVHTPTLARAASHT